MVNEARVLEVVGWLEKAGRDADFRTVVMNKIEGKNTTSEVVALHIDNSRERSETGRGPLTFSVTYKFPVSAVQEHTKLNDEEMKMLKEYIAAIPHDGIIEVKLRHIVGEGFVEGGEYIEICQYNHVPSGMARQFLMDFHEFVDKTEDLIDDYDEPSQPDG